MIAKKIDLDVRGMTCPSCAHHVEEALKKVEGVEDAKVSRWDSNEATVSLSSDVDEGELINAVELAGYKASLKEQKFALDIPQGSGNGNQHNDFDLLIIGAGSALACSGASTVLSAVMTGLASGVAGSSLIISVVQPTKAI